MLWRLCQAGLSRPAIPSPWTHRKVWNSDMNKIEKKQTWHLKAGWSDSNFTILALFLLAGNDLNLTLTFHYVKTCHFVFNCTTCLRYCLKVFHCYSLIHFMVENLFLVYDIVGAYIEMRPKWNFYLIPSSKSYIWKVERNIALIGGNVDWTFVWNLRGVLKN